MTSDSLEVFLDCLACLETKYGMCPVHSLQTQKEQLICADPNCENTECGRRRKTWHQQNGAVQLQKEAMFREQQERYEAAYSLADKFIQPPLNAGSQAYKRFIRDKNRNRDPRFVALENKVADLRASIIELKEYAEEKMILAAEMESKGKMGVRDIIFLQEVSKRRRAMNDIVEHCFAALEKNDAL